MSILVIDTETTGLDFWQGCRPFYVATLSTEYGIRSYEWDVHPQTRTPNHLFKDVWDIRMAIESHDLVVMHNAKFDVRALETVGVPTNYWEKVHDTHILHHVLANNSSHKLKDIALLNLDIPKEDQEELRDAIVQARRIAKALGWEQWQGKDQDGNAWAAEMWLPRAVAVAENYAPNHAWFKVLSRYGNTDVERTYGIWQMLQEALAKESVLPAVYERRRKLLPIVYKMEACGLTIIEPKLRGLMNTMRIKRSKLLEELQEMAGIADFDPQKTKQLQYVMFDKLNIPITPRTRMLYSTDKVTLTEHLERLRPQSLHARFIRTLLAYRSCTTNLNYVQNYSDNSISAQKDYKVLHPSVNICGTDTTRSSSSNPNGQNIGKLGEYNLRSAFGPAPEREWYMIDYQNIELRIFAYCSGEQALIEAFDRGESVHLLFAEVVYPDLFKKLGPEKFKETEQYRYVKNGNFSLIYGANEHRANLTYKVPGAYQMIRSRFKQIDRFMVNKAQEVYHKGYVTTLGGYRLYVPESAPHKACNYFVQGSAGDAMNIAMVEIADYMQANLPDDYHMMMLIHDELAFDFPIKPYNPQIVKKIASIMEQSGTTLGVSLPVDAKRVTNNWAAGEPLHF